MAALLITSKQRRNPWPDEVSEQYAKIVFLVKQAEVRLIKIKYEGLKNGKNIYLIEVLMPQLRKIVLGIKSQIIDFEELRPGRAARWALDAITEIDFACSRMLPKLAKAQTTINSNDPNFHLVRVVVEQCLVDIEEMKLALKQGPKPENEIAELDEVWKEGFNGINYEGE